MSQKMLIVSSMTNSISSCGLFRINSMLLIIDSMLLIIDLTTPSSIPILNSTNSSPSLTTTKPRNTQIQQLTILWAIIDYLMTTDNFLFYFHGDCFIDEDFFFQPTIFFLFCTIGELYLGSVIIFSAQR